MSMRAATVALAALCAAGVVHGQDCREAASRGPAADPVAQGGRLYDNWWVSCQLPAPTGAHPAYPAAGKQSGLATWRCKECHGWDYRGRDGAYGQGSHATGIAGISRSAGRADAEIVSILKNAVHRFDTVLDDATLGRIAGFVSRGQVDPGKRIDPATKRVTGNATEGRAIFERECIACHGAGGRALNFSDKPDAPEYVGTVAADNPWEALHKIRNGQPGAVMDRRHLDALAADPDTSPGMRHGGRMGMGMGMHMIEGRAMPPMRETLSLEQQFNLLSYLQTLPTR
jgi:thiosulfate dehydrogenase